MTFSKSINIYLIAFLSLSFLFLPLTSLRAATLTNNMDASYVLGSGAATQDFTATSSGLSASEFNAPSGVFFDSVNQRLFVSEDENARVLVFNTDSDGIPLDYTADYVLGQSDFISNTATVTQSGLNEPQELAYDPNNDYLFVVDKISSPNPVGRIMIYDLSGGITNGMNASYVLAQENFTDAVQTVDIDTDVQGEGIAYDSVNERLFYSTVRVLVWDLSGGITNGMDASYVLGQPDFDTVNGTITATGIESARANSLAYDDVNDYLYAGDQGNYRILVYDVSSITNGEAAINVIGQPDFTSGSNGGWTNKTFAGNPFNGFAAAFSFDFDSVNQRLFVGDVGRGLVFDMSGGLSDYMEASYVLGEDNFLAAGLDVDQKGFVATAAVDFNSNTNNLYIADFLFTNRILIFNLTPTSSSSSSFTYTHPPTCSATFSPSTITQGQQTTLSWNTQWPTERTNTYYTKVPGEGLYSQNVSSLTLQPQHTTTYTLAIFNLWGANFCNTTITVLDSEGQELTSNNSTLTAGVSHSPIIKAIFNTFRSLFGR